MEKFIQTHKIFGIVFAAWVIGLILVFVITDVPKGGDTLVFPFETLDLTYLGFWELLIYGVLPLLFYNWWSQRNRDDNEDETFSSANVEFISDLNLSLRIVEIIQGADKFLTLVSPFIHLSPPIKKELKLLQGTDVELYVIFGKNERNISKSLPVEDLELFKGFKNVRIAYVDTLHAKFYANQDYMILSSMNLLEYSQVMNSECGIRIKPTSYVTDSENTIWNDVLGYFKDLYDASKIVYKKSGKEFEDNSRIFYSTDISLNKKSALETVNGNSVEPRNAGAPWTEKEELRLVELYRGDKSISAIAEMLGRKYGGIRARLQKLGEIED